MRVFSQAMGSSNLTLSAAVPRSRRMSLLHTVSSRLLDAKCISKSLRER
jgi:hypothetical protein